MRIEIHNYKSHIDIDCGRQTKLRKKWTTNLIFYFNTGNNNWVKIFRNTQTCKQIQLLRNFLRIYVVVNLLSQVIFVFLLIFGMVIYANEVETKEKMKITQDKKLTTTFIAELSRAKRAQRAPWVSKSTHPRKFGNHVTDRPTVRPHHRETNVQSHTF